MCYKIPLSKSDAQRSAESLRRAGEDDPKAPIGVYKCADCGRWHVRHNKHAKDAEQ